MKYTVTNWIEDLQKDGRVCFSLAETIEKFPLHNKIVLKNALTRLVGKKKYVQYGKVFM